MRYVLGTVVGFALVAGLAVGGQEGGALVELDGLKSRTPASWQEKPVSPIQKQGGRLHHFVLPKGGDAKYDTEVFVFFLGGQGGSVKQNMSRWQGMFIPPQGKSIDDVTKIEEAKAGEVPVTFVELHGTYKFKKAPFVPDEQAEKRPNHRMVMVYFDSKNGPYYFRLVGPEKSVEQHRKSFDDWVKGFK
jgi:hypothetical protein